MSATGIAQHCQVALGSSVESLALQSLCFVFPACGIALSQLTVDAAVKQFAYLYRRIQADQHCRIPSMGLRMNLSPENTVYTGSANPRLAVLNIVIV